MSASRRYQLGSFVTSVRDGANHARLPAGGTRLGSKTDASMRGSDPRPIATNCAEIREIGSANRAGRLGQSCRLHLDLEQYCRIMNWTPEPTLAPGPPPSRSRSGTRGPVSPRRAAGDTPRPTKSYKFVRQLFVYDTIVATASFGRSPVLIRFSPGRRLATCYKRDYDPCPALGGYTRPGRASMPARATHAASHARPRGRRDTRYEGL